MMLFGLPSNSFVASSNCALYCGAKVDFVDIDLDTDNMSIPLLETKLIRAKKENNLPKVLIPVHLSGNSCDMEKIYNLSKTYGFKILEDASHCIRGMSQKLPNRVLQFQMHVFLVFIL